MNIEQLKQRKYELTKQVAIKKEVDKIKSDIKRLEDENSSGIIKAVKNMFNNIFKNI